MPQELPGFYFDQEKNRYFPIKSPIPGSNVSGAGGVSRGKARPSSKPQLKGEAKFGEKKRIKGSDLLLYRELHGNTLSVGKCMKSFEQEYRKLLASHPIVWKYRGTEGKSDTAIEQFCLEIQTPSGQRKTSVLLMGSLSGSLSLFEIGNPERDFDGGVMCMPDCVWPLTSKYKMDRSKEPGPIHNRIGASTLVPSNISCIKNVRRNSLAAVNDSLSSQLALVTTLGSGTSGGSVCLLNLYEPLDFSHRIPTLQRRIHRITSLPYTIWNADCQPNGTLAAVGMNLGVAMINIETGALTWVCRSKSDALSQQFDPSGNILLCGFRNGKIASIDIRQKPESQTPIVLPRCTTSLSRSRKRLFSDIHSQMSTQRWLKLKGNMKCTSIICAASAVCSLVALKSYDQYFLASSMDGSIKLYDQRMCHGGAIQSYDGHMNTHSHLQMGVDPSESFLMSGGEDGYVRLWSIKSGEMLFGVEVSDSAVSNVCWSQVGEFGEMIGGRDTMFLNNHSWGAWLGSHKGLFYMHGL